MPKIMIMFMITHHCQKQLDVAPWSYLSSQYEATFKDSKLRVILSSHLISSL
jgi:hypothetical protein